MGIEMDKPRMNRVLREVGDKKRVNLFSDKTCHSKTVNTTNELKLLSK